MRRVVVRENILVVLLPERVVIRKHMLIALLLELNCSGQADDCEGAHTGRLGPLGHRGRRLLRWSYENITWSYCCLNSIEGDRFPNVSLGTARDHGHSTLHETRSPFGFALVPPLNHATYPPGVKGDAESSEFCSVFNHINFLMNVTGTSVASCFLNE